jgi:hypothetical protein
MSFRVFLERKHRFFTALQILGICVAVFFFASMAFFDWYPHSGVSVAVLAVLAAAMSLQADMKGPHKALWMLIFGAFLVAELLAISHESREESATRLEENKQFGLIASGLQLSLSQSAAQFDQTMKTYSNADKIRQGEFRTTMGRFSQTERSNQEHFSRVLDHEDELDQAESGVLMPGAEPTPANNCRDFSPKSIVVMIGNESQHNAAVFEPLPHQPHVILTSRAHGQVLALTRSGEGNLAVILDLRSDDGKIIARMDESGYVINRITPLRSRRAKVI